MAESGRTEDLARIDEALDAARRVLEPYTPGDVATTFKEGDDPLTEADLAVDAVLRDLLPRRGEGWLSEETVDDEARLACDRVWVVDPIDGTREFVAGIPEWCVSIGLIERGVAVAGGVDNPTTDERMVGAMGHGVTSTGAGPIARHRPTALAVAASRSEIRRGEWDAYTNAPFRIVPVGSVAYKLALVAVGAVDATWTRSPKHEWDVAGGAALVLAAGGWIALADGSPPSWNRRRPRLSGFAASTASARDRLAEFAIVDGGQRT